MIPVASTLNRTETFESADSTEFTIGDPRWVMQSLADLYSDKETATVRELSTNARDANVEAGNSHIPIRVTLPTMMKPYFIVEDDGTGMSTHELKTIYTSFGTSTKRDSNDFNGLLGFGSKAPIAYTNTVTVTSVKDGQKTMGIVTRSEDYSIVLKIVMVSPTPERDGTRIEVPVHNADEFTTKARNFYKFWLPNTVLVDGKAPETAVGNKIDENFYYLETNHFNTSYVVMGNVPYRIENPAALFPNGVRAVNFVAYVNNGDVEFTPSREALKYTDLTKTTLRSVVSDFLKRMTENAHKEIKSQPTAWQAFERWKTLEGLMGRNALGSVSWRGEQMGYHDVKVEAKCYNSQLHRYTTESVRQFNINEQSRALFITGFVKNLNANHKRAAKNYAASMTDRPYLFFFIEDKDFKSKWVDPKRVVPWEKVKESMPKPPKRVHNPANAGRKAGTFDIVDAENSQMLYEQDVPAKNIYWIQVATWNEWVKSPGGGSTGRIRLMFKAFGIKKVVKVPANRKDKFLREYPQATHVSKILERKVVVNEVALLSSNQKLARSMDGSTMDLINKVDVTKVDDKRFAEYQKAWLTARDEEDKSGHHRMACGILGKTFLTYQPPSVGLATEYPLAMPRYFYGNMDAGVQREREFYINAKYKAMKEKK